MHSLRVRSWLMAGRGLKVVPVDGIVMMVFLALFALILTWLRARLRFHHYIPLFLCVFRPFQTLELHVTHA